jgi:hypothetical protein
MWVGYVGMSAIDFLFSFEKSTIVSCMSFWNAGMWVRKVGMSVIFSF